MVAMKYSGLADIYEQLEHTTKKLEKTTIIAKVLKKASSKILPNLVLLLQGKIFPAWSAEETGVASQLMIKAISRATGVEPADILKKFRDVGDLGLTAELFIKKKVQRTLYAKTLTVEKVFENLQKIAKQTGKGSQERKLNLIAELLSHSSPKETRYIVRTVLEELRIGVAEGIVRDAIAQAYNIPKKVVENAWFLHPDYGEIAKVAKKSGEVGLKKIKIELGMPVMVLLAEKAPDLKTALAAFDRPILEFKYDGMRTLIHKKGNKIWIFTRRLENISSAFPDIVEYCKKCLKPKRCVVDGETLGIDPKSGRPMPFQLLSTRIKRKYEIERMAKELPAQVNLFDILYLEGKTLFDLPLEKRREILKNNVKELKGKFQLAEFLITKDFKKADAFYKKALKAGQEGLIIKNLDAKYQSGRRVAGGWLKVKPIMETLDLAIIGATWGTGKRTGWLGSFILGCRDPTTGKFLECGMLGTGVKEKKTKATDVTLKELTKMLKPYIEWEKDNKVKIKPKVVIEVAYEEIQKSPTYVSGWALRFPRFIRLRLDKAPSEVDTSKRIKKLYEIQRGKTKR